MTFQNCTPKTALLVAVLALVIIFANRILTALPMLKLLFTDTVSFILITLLCVFTLLVDIPTGIILSLIVIVLGLYISEMPVQQKSERFFNVATDDAQFASDSEFFYKDNEVKPNGNIPPFQVPDATPLKQTTAGMIPVNSNEAGSKSCMEPDFITRVGPPNRDGYDVAGCRYDMKESPQNLTRYGPPLAQCGAYSGKSYSCTGTLFYPLNE